MLTQKRYLSCQDCGQTSPPAEFAPEAQELARQEGWFVAERGRVTRPTNSVRSQGQNDYCPACRVKHELVYCESTTSPRGTPRPGGYCSYLAVVTITRDDTVVNSCAFHAWVMEKELLIADRDSVVTVRLLPE